MYFRICFLIFINLTISQYCYSENPSGLSVSYDNNKSSTFSFNEDPKIFFIKNEMLIKTSQSSIIFPMKKFKSLTYISSSSNGLNEKAINSHPLIQIQGNEFIITSSNDDLEIQIFNLEGILILNKTVKSGESFSKTLNPGIFIINIDGQTFKIHIG